MNPPSRPLRHKDYTIACICPMGVEQAPVEAMLDEFHPDLPTNRNQNSYTLGRMGRHNVVIVILPGIGLNSAAAVTMQLLNDFPSVEFGLLVGIAGGVPDLQRGVDIRLGDVVVSKPSGTSGGVVHFAYGPALGNGRFERIGKSYRPPEVLLAAVTRMEALHRRGGSQIPLYLDQMLQKYPKMRRGNYVYQGAENDRLFEAEFDHHGGRDCADCDPERIIERELRLEDSPVVHYGAIGSSDVVVKDGRMRDRLREDLEIKCVEMEAAGVLEVVPCLVIRGICDYADSHKNKRWQPYAAAVAASYMKELLSMVPPIQVQDAILEQGMVDRDVTRTAVDILLCLFGVSLAYNAYSFLSLG